jgi:hypothetical protein
MVRWFGVLDCGEENVIHGITLGSKQSVRICILARAWRTRENRQPLLRLAGLVKAHYHILAVSLGMNSSDGHQSSHSIRILAIKSRRNKIDMEGIQEQLSEYWQRQQ